MAVTSSIHSIETLDESLMHSDSAIMRSHENTRQTDALGSEQVTRRLTHMELDVSQDEIRLLVLCPGAKNDPVSCFLKHAKCTNGGLPSYETISYVWGDQQLRSTIFVNDTAVDVPASSQAVLHQFRHPNEDRTLWLDSVCIDQTNLEERSHQVGLMGRIYAHSTLNLIWLGEDEGATERALLSLQAILSDMREETNNFETVRKTLFVDSGLSRFSPSGITEPFEVEPLLDYFSSPWFSRVWTAQEACLSLKSVCYRGQFRIPFEHVVRVATWILHKRFYIPSALPNHQGIINLGYIADYADHEYGFFRFFPEGGSSMLNILFCLRQRVASEPKDHVFGVLGLLEKYLRQDLPTMLVPNYELSMAEIYQNATRFAVEQAGDLQALLYVSHRSYDQDTAKISSWCPRWDKKPEDDKDPVSFRMSEYSASGQRSMVLRPMEPSNSHILEVAGMTLDEIGETTSVFRETGEGFNVLHIIEAARPWADAVAVAKDQTAASILASVLRAGRSNKFRRNDIENTWIADPQEPSTSYSAFKRLVDESDEAPPSLLSLADDTPSYVKTAAEFWHVLCMSCLQRRLFKTTSNRIGLGPESMQPEDLIVILYGCNMPAVLRRCESDDTSYMFVGLAYVYGVMDGAVARAHEELGRDDVIFRIL